MMSNTIDGFEEGAPKADRRTREYRDSMRGDGEREAMRADLRPDSIREAEAYAERILDSGGFQDDGMDEFFVNESIIPPGWAYQWRRQTLAGKEDPHYMVGLKRNGWREVPASRHPEMMPIGWEGAIEKKGLVLMELPKILVDRQLQAQKREAIDQIRDSEAQLTQSPPNTAPRDDPGLKRANLGRATRTYESPVPVSRTEQQGA